MNRRDFLKWASVSSLSAAGLGAYGYSEAYHFQVSRHTFELAGLEAPLKLVQLSDLHFGMWIDDDTVRHWVEAAQRERPEVIVVTGDLVDRLPSQAGLERLARVLGGLKAPLGVWAVLGNHDYWPGSIETPELVARLSRAGLRFLVNDSADIRSDLHLAGIDDILEGQPDLERALQSASNKATILLAHNPDVLVSVPEGVGLTISGHTHGGQVRIPGLPTLFNASDYGERFQMGFVRANGQSGAHGFVSRGIGFGGVPIRTFCPAELVVLNLVPA